MGAVYDVELKLKYASEQSVIDATKAFVNANSGYVKFSDIDYSTMESAIQIILPRRGFHINSQANNYIDCNCGFDASYGWESVMQDWFNSLVADYAVQDNSTITIYPDSGWETGVAKGGTAHWENDEGYTWGEGQDAYPVQEPDRPVYTKPEKPVLVPMVVDDQELQEAINLINDYCEGEFDHIGIDENTNLADVGLMYSTAGDEDQVELQVTVDLDNLEMRYEVNGELRHTDKYSSLRQLITDELERLDFNDLYAYVVDFVTDEDFDI